jgi:hypothetical protein
MNGPRICTQPCNARRHTCCRAAAPHLRPTRKNASRKRRRDARDNVANGGPLAIGPLAGGEQMVVGLLRLRFAAGVCVLAAGLLMGAGGAIAVADPDARGSTAHGDHETNTSGQQHSTGPKKPKHEPGATTSGTGANAPGLQPKKPKDEPGATTVGTGATTVGTGATTVGTGATTVGTGATTVGTGATVTDVVAAVPSLAASVRMGTRRYPIWSRQFLTSSR